MWQTAYLHCLGGICRLSGMEPERVISKFHLPANVPSGVKCRMRSHGSQGYTEPKFYFDVLRPPRPRPSRLPRLFSLRTGFPVVRHPLSFQMSNDRSVCAWFSPTFPIGRDGVLFCYFFSQFVVRVVCQCFVFLVNQFWNRTRWCFVSVLFVAGCSFAAGETVLFCKANGITGPLWCVLLMSLQG